MNTEVKNARVDEWIKAQLAADTNGEMVFHITPKDVSETLSPNEVLDLIQYCDQHRNMSVEDCAAQWLAENCSSIISNNEQAFIDAWRINAEDIDVADMRAAVNDALDELETAGFKKAGLDCFTLDVKDFVREQSINLLFATANERDCELGLIPTIVAMLDGEATKQAYAEIEENSDNALGYLIHQQGYQWRDVYEAYGRSEYNETRNLSVPFDGVGGSNFTNSVAAELDNIRESTACLAISITIDADTLFELLEAQRDSKNEKYVTISKNSLVGLFNPEQGEGAFFEIELEKPAVMPVSMIKSIQVENTNHPQQNNEYTVNSVYAFPRDHWKGTIEVTNDAPELAKENYAEAKKALTIHQHHRDEMTR